LRSHATIWPAKSPDEPEQVVIPISESVKAGNLAEVDLTTESATPASEVRAIEVFHLISTAERDAT
jgi:hypothetical protein